MEPEELRGFNADCAMFSLLDLTSGQSLELHFGSVFLFNPFSGLSLVSVLIALLDAFLAASTKLNFAQLSAETRVSLL